jgi:spermidine/putrescine transport system permease protein
MRSNWLSRFPSLVLVVATYLFLYVPLLVLVIFSFNNDPFPAPWSGFTLDWYRELWVATELWEAFTTSCVIALSATCLSLLMGIMFVFFLMKSTRARRILGIFYANLIVPEVVLAVGLLSMFSFLEIELGVRTLIIAHTVLGLGYVIPVIYQKYMTINPHLVDVSMDLGATLGQTFVYIILPLLRPALYAAGLLVFIISFDDFILSYFCAGSSAQTLSIYIYNMLRIGISPVVNALSTLLLVISSICVMLFCYYNVRSKLL